MFVVTVDVEETSQTAWSSTPSSYGISINFDKRYMGCIKYVTL